MKGLLFIICAAILAYGYFEHRGDRPIVYPPGVLVSEKPLQTDIRATSFFVDDYELTRRARFEIRARVLGRERYYLRRESDLSPLDLALGWGVMSDEAVLERIDVSQSNRWYFTRYEYPAPLSNEQITTHSSNMHMIPARKSIERRLKELRPGSIVTLKGYLVDVYHVSGWHWRTSLSRTDTGNG
ncbi:MAG: hypothetical protein OQJ84_07200, partial [Xanthomonadales bacterium]|nr:hypothetical protein [Xanthomonadales bacterium]